jgi:acyl transferase domain-containing protein
LLVGSVKANIGHLESASGMAGLIKTVLSLKQQQVPPQIHFEQANPHIQWHKLPVKIPQALTPWPQSQDSDNGAIAAVSSFGFGGTNAHVICQQPPAVAKPAQSTPSGQPQVLALSAKSEVALMATMAQFERYLVDHEDVSTQQLCQTANSRGSHFAYRAAFSGSNNHVIAEQIQAKLRHLQQPPSEYCEPPASCKNGAVFLFTGQGSQYFGMAKTLFDNEPVFRRAMMACNDILLSELAHPIVDVLYSDSHADLLDRADYTQVSLFAVQYSLVKLWEYWGVTPALLLGHSVGEYVAACIAGVFSLEQGLRLLATRGRLMQALETRGKMIAVRAPAAIVDELVNDYPQQVSVAAYHGKSGVVISGENDIVDKIAEQLEVQSYSAIRLNTARAFHSPLMAPMLAEFEQAAQSVQFNKPHLPMLSSVTGHMTSLDMTNADYWVRQIREPVQLASCIEALDQGEWQYFLEIGPKPILINIVQQNLNDAAAVYFASLTRESDAAEQMTRTLARVYESGFEVNWAQFHQHQPAAKLALPGYPFEADRYWVNLDKVAKVVEKPAIAATQPAVAPVRSIVAKPQQVVEQPKTDVPDRREQISQIIRSTIAQLMETSADKVKLDTPLLEMGVDSLMLTKAVNQFERQFDLNFTIRQFYEQLTTLAALIEYVDQHSAFVGETPAVETVAPVELAANMPLVSDDQNPVKQAISHDTIVAVCSQQLATAASVGSSYASEAVHSVTQQQLQFLQNLPVAAMPGDVVKPAVPVATVATVESVKKVADKDKKSSGGSLIWAGKVFKADKGSESQLQHLEQLIEEQNSKTPGSKALAQRYRVPLADNRTSAGFRLSTKQMLYPLIAERAQGARVWDVDGNEYIDLTMDFGANLFGHQPAFIIDAIVKQAQTSLQLGLPSPTTGKVAELICQLTGAERVAFSNSGTEAVMTSLRLARTKTGRNKVVQFSGSYHGHYDGTLGQNSFDGNGVEASCAGITQGAVANSIILPYGQAEALEAIAQQADDIAAVLVEPVQSRRPEFQPWEFLKQLRTLTEQKGIALIFDEMITGFRAHPGGVQGMLGFKADMTTFGKIVGGGMPIGVVAGSSDYLDGIDGGEWSYDDGSYPDKETTFFAGTFCKHPVTMASAYAVLKEIQQRGPQLQQSLAAKTTALAERLDRFFIEEGIPMNMVHFASLFRFSFKQNMDLFFYHLQCKGIYIWEGRNCFLSDAHTQADIDFIVEAVMQSALALKQAGYFTATEQQPAQIKVPKDVADLSWQQPTQTINEDDIVVSEDISKQLDGQLMQEVDL